MGVFRTDRALAAPGVMGVRELPVAGAPAPTLPGRGIDAGEAALTAATSSSNRLLASMPRLISSRPDDDISAAGLCGEGRS
jgi:hypothetical protein